MVKPCKWRIRRRFNGDQVGQGSGGSNLPSWLYASDYRPFSRWVILIHELLIATTLLLFCCLLNQVNRN